MLIKIPIGAPGGVEDYKGTTLTLPWNQVGNLFLMQDSDKISKGKILENLNQVAYSAEDKEYEDYQEAYYEGDYQGSEEYQYHYDGEDYPDYEEDYSQEQVIFVYLKAAGWNCVKPRVKMEVWGYILFCWQDEVTIWLKVKDSNELPN